MVPYILIYQVFILSDLEFFNIILCFVDLIIWSKMTYNKWHHVIFSSIIIAAGRAVEWAEREWDFPRSSLISAQLFLQLKLVMVGSVVMFCFKVLNNNPPLEIFRMAVEYSAFWCLNAESNFNGGPG